MLVEYQSILFLLIGVYPTWGSPGGIQQPHTELPLMAQLFFAEKHRHFRQRTKNSQRKSNRAMEQIPYKMGPPKIAKLVYKWFNYGLW